MEKRIIPPNFDDDSGQPAKTRRTTRACLQCRMRKQKCLPSNLDVYQAPCKRCRHHAITCSFETDQLPGPDSNPSPSRMAQIIVNLQQRMNSQEARMLELENQAKQSSLPPRRTIHSNSQTHNASPLSQIESSSSHDHFVNGQPIESSDQNVAVSSAAEFSMDTLDLGPPIATLRSLGALSKEGADFQCHMSGKPPSQEKSSPYDPITRGILSIQDAKKTIDIYFDHCHPMAPVLNERIRKSGLDLRANSPILFLTICSIGARFWHGPSFESGDTRGLHPGFFDLTSRLDTAVSRLLLKPTPSEVTLDSIRVLLLYAQWMPCSSEDESEDPLRSANKHPTARSRYNDISAWAVLGLAARYAVFIGLDRTAITPFQSAAKSISEEDFTRLRVWYNLITCECNLTLTSGLPPSLDPTTASGVAHLFGSHRIAQQPGDLRYAALVELAVIIYRSTQSCCDLPGRQLDAFSLRKANTELDEWERSWLVQLRHTDSQHSQLPFTSVRWYRLALNSASLGPLLSSLNRSQARPLQVWLLQSLEISLTAASQMLLSLSKFGAEHVWKLESQNSSSFPEGSFEIDTAALKRLYYAVDSTWISHTYAVTFLVLCYVRGTIDENLQIRSLTSGSVSNSPRLPLESTSILARLLELALYIFDGVCSPQTFHPAQDFQAIIHNVCSLVLGPVATGSHDGQEVDNSAMQSLLDLINDSGLEWPGNLLDTNSDFSTGWDIDGMLGA